MITKGKWAAYIDTETQDAASIDVEHTGHEKTYQEIAWIFHRADARFIVTAINACQYVNSDNPQAVAESIKGMYEALKGILNLCNGYTELDKETCSLYISKILDKAEGK